MTLPPFIEWDTGREWDGKTSRTVARAHRPTEPGRWMLRTSTKRTATWFDVADRDRTVTTQITYHEQTRTVTEWADVQPALEASA